MKIIETKVYLFDELTDDAKEKARDWWREGGLDQEDAWDSVREDAEQVGLKITSLDDYRNNEGKFIVSASDTVRLIKENHGEHCDTFKTALKYSSLLVDQEDEDTAYEFLDDLLEDYRIMLNKEIEYRYSDESVDENLRCNEYTFTENGKRF